MRRLYDRILSITQILAQIVLAFMVVTICYDAIMRYAFTAPTSWSLEINTFLLVYLAIVGAADVLRVQSHIRISFFADKLPVMAQRVVRGGVGLVGVAFCGIMAWRGGLLSYQAWDYGERVSSSFGTPMVFPYGILPIGFGLLTIQFALDVLDAATGVDITPPQDEPTQPL